MQYFFVYYAYEPNAILVRLMGSRETMDMVGAYKYIYNYLKTKGFNQDSTSPIMNVLRLSSHTSRVKTVTGNSWNQITIESTRQNELYRHLNVTLLQGYLQ